MPYLKCPSCGLLAHVQAGYPTAIRCPRCRAVQQQIQLAPLDESVRHGDSSPSAAAETRR